MASELMSSTEVAATLGVTRSTVNRWASMGALPVAMKLPGRLGMYLYDRAEIEALKDDRCKTA